MTSQKSQEFLCVDHGVNVAETPEVPLDSLLTVLYSLDYVVSSARWLLGGESLAAQMAASLPKGIQVWKVLASNWQVASSVQLPSRELYQGNFEEDFPLPQVGYVI